MSGRVIPAPPEPIQGMALTQAWRLEHAQRGDLALITAAAVLGSSYTNASTAQAWALIAQAHYAAANVRARPVADAVVSPIVTDPTWPL